MNFLWTFVAAAACAPAKPASAPEPTAPPAATPNAKNEPKTGSPAGEEIAPDAMRAMAGLSGFWMMLGVTDADWEKPSGFHRHAGSGVCMPTASKRWEAGKTQVYATDDESVTLWSEPLATEVTLYTYPVVQALDAEFRDVLAQMSHTCTEGPMMSTSLGETHVGGCVRRVERDLLLLEQVVLFQRGKWLHKARITFPAAAARAAYGPAMAVVSRGFEPCTNGP